MTGPGRPAIGPVRQIRIPDSMWADLEREAAEAAASVPEIIRLAISDYLAWVNEGKDK